MDRGDAMRMENEMIPRSWTEPYIHMLMRPMHRDRNSRFAGMYKENGSYGGFVGDVNYWTPPKIDKVQF